MSREVVFQDPHRYNSSLKYFTIREERAVRIPKPNIPTLKFKWSATNPKTKGPPPVPKITPIAIMNPIVIDL